MDVSATSSAATASAAQKAQSSLSTNFNTFLTLLTTQLKNQDPLSPMDSNQFTQQLVQFSQVEQQINANQNLETLISLTKGRSSTDAVSYLGKTLTLTDGTAPLMNGKATWAYSLDSDSTTTRLMVLNAAGKAVYVADGETGWAELNRENVERLAREVPIPTVRLPYLFTEEFGAAQVDALSREIGRAHV